VCDLFSNQKHQNTQTYKQGHILLCATHYHRQNPKEHRPENQLRSYHQNLHGPAIFRIQKEILPAYAVSWAKATPIITK